MKKVLGALSRFARQKMKLSAVEFKRILEVLCDGRFPVVHILGGSVSSMSRSRKMTNFLVYSLWAVF